jgi:hypothetical protein
MRRHQSARVFEKHSTLGGQANRTRRTFDQPFADHGFQPLQLHADRGLRRAQRLGGAGKTLQFGDQHEGLHRR